MKRGCDRVMQALAGAGVRHIFALSGNQIMPLFDASIEAGIRLYHTRHEAAAVYMAEGYAQLSGGVGVALVTAGAGLGNAIGPLLTARASDTPLLLLSGDSPVARDGQGAFQEMDQVGLTQSATKWSCRVTQADALSQTINEAYRLAASGRPGPIHISLPADVLLAETEVAAQPSRTEPDTPNASMLRDWLSAAQRPVLVLGPSLNATRQPGLAVALEQAAGAPVVVMESPRGLKDPALGAMAALFAEADRVLLLGKPLDFTMQFGSCAPDAAWALVHSDPGELHRAAVNRGSRVDISLEADPSEMARALALDDAAQDQRAGQGGETWRRRFQRARLKRAEPQPDNMNIAPDGLCSAVQRFMDELGDPLLVCDGGEFGQWAQAGISARRRIINGVSGAIGGGLCYAMAARVADPKAEIFALMGDGTAGFHFMEFETAVRENLPFVAIIGNDQRWNAEHQIQLREFGSERLHSCALSRARYDLAAEALGGFGALVTSLSELPEAMARALASGKPACINVMIEGAAAPNVALG